MSQGATALKAQVKEHWEAETCGTRYADRSGDDGASKNGANESAVDEADRKQFFAQISEARYSLEPYIAPFADFTSAQNKRVLEIGVGAGADFENWCRHAAHASGVDLTQAAIALTEERLRLNGVASDKYELQSSDAENLVFNDNSFDLVYSWGVLHHSPDTPRAFAEAMRVLRPGGTLKAMIYHVPSWTGLMLKMQHGLLKGRLKISQKQAIFSHLESPGTKAYTIRESRDMLTQIGFCDIQLSTKLAPGDLLTIKPSKKYQSMLFSVIWKIYPRPLVRLLGDRYGLNLMIEAKKPRSQDSHSTS